MKNKIFDIHTDILYDIYTHKKEGNLTRFKDYHLPQLQSSVITGGVWTLYSPTEFNLFETLKDTISSIDFKALGDFDIILGLESLRNLKSIDELQKIYDLGFRHAMLTWNEENAYATGVNGSPDRGLTLAGREVLDFMIDHNMIIDVSHLNKKSFYEVLDYTNHNIIASHSNVKAICDHKRNLDDNQLKRLKEVNGLLGLTMVGAFIAKDKEDRTLRKFIDHVIHAISILGVDNVCIGFDFMDYFDSSVGSNIEELPSANFSQRLIDALLEYGFTQEQIYKITYSNFYDRYKSLIYIGG